MDYVKIYGIQTSGTNYAEKMIQVNFQSVCLLRNILGWKHGLFTNEFDWQAGNWDSNTPSIKQRSKLLKQVTPELKKATMENDIRYLVIAKHPYATIASFAAKNTHNTYEKISFDEINISDILTKYNQLYTNWLNAHNHIWRYSCLIRYEDFLTNYEETLSAIQRALSLQPREKFRNIDQYVDRNRNCKGEFIGRNWYLNQEYLKYFSNEDMMHINKKLKPEIVEIFGHLLPKTEN